MKLTKNTTDNGRSYRAARPVPWFGLAISFGLVAAFAAVWPGLLSGAYVGTRGVDAWGTQWFYDWVARWISGETELLHSSALFAPWGKDLYAHTGGNVLDAVLAWPFRVLWGPVKGYGLFVAAVLLSNGGAAWWVVRRMGAGGWGMALAGLVSVWNPLALHELAAGRPTQALLAFAIVAVGSAWSLWRRWEPAMIAIGGVALALTGLCYWFNALFIGFALLLCLPVAYLSAPNAAVRRRRLLALLGMLGLAAILVLPVVWTMVTDWAAGSVAGVLDVDKLRAAPWKALTQDGFAIALHVFDPVGRQSGFFVPDAGEMVFVGGNRVLPLVTIVSLGIGWWRGPRSLRAPIAVLVAVSLCLAVGPRWWPSGGPNNPVFGWLVQTVPFFDRLWWPFRAVVLLQVVAALAVAWVIADDDSRAVRWCTAVGLPVLLAWEICAAGLVPLHTWSVPPSAVYDCLARAPAGVVMELPYGSPDDHVFRQTLHHQPTFGGMFDDNPEFTPPEQLRFREQSVAFLGLDTWARSGQGPALMAADLEPLKALGIRYFVFDQTAIARVDAARTRRSRALRHGVREFLGTPVIEDERFVLYAPFGEAAICVD